MLETRVIETRGGVSLRCGVWPSGEGGRGVCALLDGQTEFLEKYEEVAGELCARGFTVAALDWRGQGASDRALPDHRKAHVADFAQYDEDLRAFLAHVVAPLDPRQPVALAHSMGGHILLRALHAMPGSFAAAAMTAPLIEADTRSYPAWVARSVCSLQNISGHKSDWVWGMQERDPLSMRFEDNLVTSDRARFERARAALKNNPELRLCGPTWGWLEAAYRSMALVRSPGFAEAITTPMLITGAGRDRIVRTAATRKLAVRLAHTTYVELEDSEHEILMENDSIRARFWDAFDAFVGKTCPSL